MTRRRASLSRRPDEAGFAVPTVLFMLLAAMGIVGAGLLATVNAQSGVTRDADTKTAFAAAEAGLNEALYRYNRVPVAAATPCLLNGTGGQVVMSSTSTSPAGWCAPVQGSIGPEGSSEDATYSYQVMPVPSGGSQTEIVSTGIDDGVSRRIRVTAEMTTDETTPFKDFGVIGRDFVNVRSNAEIHSDVGTNGSISMESTGKLCGEAQYGLNGTFTGSNHLGENCLGQGVKTQGQLDLPLVDQGDVATNNSNGRLTGLSSLGCTSAKDGRTGSAGDIVWSAQTRRLEVKSNATLTLCGSDYSFCSVTIDSKATLYVAQGVNMWFDSPESCGAGGVQVTLNSNSRISPLGAPADISLYFVGSDTIDTSIILNSNTQATANCVNGLVIYAPRTSILMDSNSTYCGAVAAKSVQVDSNAKIYGDDGATDWTLGGSGNPHYTMTSFTECSSDAVTVPNANC